MFLFVLYFEYPLRDKRKDDTVMKKMLSFLLVLAMLLSMTSISFADTMKDGTFTSTVQAMHGKLTLETTVASNKVTDIKVVDETETPGVTAPVYNEMIPNIIEKQSIAVDTITGATITSNAVMNAVADCLTQAGADMDAWKKELPKEELPSEYTADVIIVGGGGAGLAAAVSAASEGASVIVLEKSGFLGGNSIVSGGIYNAPDREEQDDVDAGLDALIEDAIAETPINDAHAQLIEEVKKEFEEYKNSDRKLFDSAAWFALQTWNGGDKLGELKMVRTMTDNAFSSLEWLEDMGMQFKPGVVSGAGSLYYRVHGAVKPNGVGYIDTFEENLAKYENTQILKNMTGNNLVMDNDKVVGVEAVNKYGDKVTFNANKGVILATGGFAGNVDLRVKLCQGEKWPNLGKSVPTSNMPAVTGDGIFMAEKAGAQLVNMDQIQLLPYCNPYTGATYDICGNSLMGMFVNKEGNRFVREDGRRDEMSKAIIDQTDGIMYMVFSADFITSEADAYMLGGKNLEYYLANNLSQYVRAETLEELATTLGMDANNLKATVESFNKHVEEGSKDEFGRIGYVAKVENGPFYAYPRKPAVHHTMGGVLVDEFTRALNADGTPIQGLYCAGEITGNLHGANRLGGNAIVDFTVFGRIAGASAAAAK